MEPGGEPRPSRRNGERGRSEAPVLPSEEWRAVISHDLRGPVVTIDLAARLLLDSGPVLENDELRSLVERMARAAGRLDQMIQNISDSVLVESGRVRLDRHRAKPSEVIEASVESVSFPPDRPLHLRIEDDLPEVELDPDDVERILHNLLQNAVDFGRAGTPIELGVTVAEGEMVFTVTSEGDGISAEDLPRIFERFFRRRPSDRARHEGLGLGLFVARGLASANGGRLWAESEPGKKTSFFLALPV